MTANKGQEAARPRRTNDPVGVRGRILDTAFAMFQERGYNATAVHDLARAASVTSGALHHHFPTKKSIGLAVIEERVGAAIDEVWLNPLASAPTAKAGITSVFLSLADQLDAQGLVRGCPVNNLTLELAFADPDFRGELRELFDRWREAIARKLGGNSEDRATMVVAAYSGAMALAKVEQRGAPLRACLKELEQQL